LIKLLTQIDLFPNPVTTYCSVSYPVATANALLSIYWVDGKKVGDYNVVAGSTQRSIDVSELKAGNYLMVYKRENQKFTSSFMK